MNLSNKIKSSLLLLLIGLLPFLSTAQGNFYEQVEVLVGETFEYDLYSYPHFPQITEFGAIGTASLGGTPSHIGFPGDNTLTYQSDQIGVDYITVKYYVGNSPFTYETIEKGFKMVVKPSIIKPIADYYTAFVNSPIVLDVLDNDEATESGLYIKSVPIVNNGSGTIDETATAITFTPSQDFTGMTHLNYMVCDEIGTCELGEVTLFVKGVTPPGIQNVTLSTPKNKALDIYVSLDNGFELTNPGHGTLEAVSNGHLLYIPSTGFSGDDNFTVSANLNGSAHVTMFEINVLAVDDGNTFAFDDYAHTEVGHLVEIDVIENDYDFSLSNPAVTVNPQHGNIIGNFGGKLTYKPHEGYEGIDKFTYRVCSQPSWDCEYAVVEIEVNNQHPVQSTFELTTPVNTPLVLEYDAIIDGFDFQLTDNANNGYVNVYQGLTTLNLNGQDITKESPIVYTPNEQFIGLDEFEVLYCVDLDCRTIKCKVLVIDVPEYEGGDFCVGDCVWSGDTNNDGRVDMKDLLPLGLCMGELGIERPEGQIGWYPQYSGEWENAFGFLPSVDLMFVDADGDGIVGSNDVNAVDEHYGRCHDITSSRAVEIEELFSLNQITENPGPGDLVEIEILLGYGVDQAAFDKYGLTFTVDYVPSGIQEGSFQVELDDDSWLAYGSPMLSLVKEPNEGRVDVGLTRTNGQSVSGYGRIGKVSFVIGDTFDGFRLPEAPSIEVKIKDGSTMNGAGHYITTNSVEMNIPVDLGLAYNQADASHLIAFPNPAIDVLNLHLNGFNKIKEYGIYSITGQKVYQSQGIFAKQTQLDISEMHAGFYIIRAITEKGTISKKIEITKN